MHVENIGGSERLFLVKCRNAAEMRELIALADTVDLEFGTCSVAKPSASKHPQFKFVSQPDHDHPEGRDAP